MRSTPTHKWVLLLWTCFYICVGCRYTSLLDLKQVPTLDITHQVRRKKDKKQRRNGVLQFRSTNPFSGGTQGAKRLIFCSMQAKLIIEKITTLFIDIYFTFLFIKIFVSHFPYVTFIKKASVIFLYLCLEGVCKVWAEFN